MIRLLIDWLISMLYKGREPIETDTPAPALGPTDEPEKPEEEPVSKYAAKKHVIQSILSVFETGKPEGDYGAVVVLKDGAGISYGLHQATDHANNLDEIVRRYVDAGGMYSTALSMYVPRLERNETTGVDPDNLPDWVVGLMTLLAMAGDKDPVMQAIQEEVFDEKYWRPSVLHCDNMGLQLPLSWAIVYDTCIHSGPSGVDRIRKRFPEVPPSKGGDEREWAIAYMRARHEWLSAYPNPTVARTAVRVEQLQGLAEAENWDLCTPFDFGPPYRVTIE